MNRYLDYFQLLEEYRGIQPFKLKFRSGLNVIVGENGSGKSSILSLIVDQDKTVCKTKLVNAEKVTNFLYFDTEKSNSRVKHDLSMSKDIGRDLAIRFVSHGEAMLPIIKHIETVSDTIIFIDEPEAGISLSNQKKMVKFFEKAVSNNCQVVLTTHSYIIIKSVEYVFDLEPREWVTSSSYLRSII